MSGVWKKKFFIFECSLGDEDDLYKENPWKNKLGIFYLRNSIKQFLENCTHFKYYVQTILCDMNKWKWFLCDSQKTVLVVIFIKITKWE